MTESKRISEYSWKTPAPAEELSKKLLRAGISHFHGIDEATGNHIVMVWGMTKAAIKAAITPAPSSAS